MKLTIKIMSLLLFTGFMVGCSDFEEINTDPNAASADQVQVEYFLNRSISGAQMNPHIAERVFVLYWNAAGRQEWNNTLPVGSYNDGWTNDYYSTGYLSGWLSGANTAIQIADEQIANGTNKTYTNNLKQAARIWRVYLMSEMADNFGPTPIDGFKGENPEFNSVEEVYNFLLTELEDATASFDDATVPGETVSEKDLAYAFNFDKWRKYGNSMRMRLAMRLSEVAPSLAQQHFESAVSGSDFISNWEESFKIQETAGWSDLTGVMTREWNHMRLTATLSNIMVGLGGVSTQSQTPSEMHSNIKNDLYLGVRYEDHFATKTNNPVAGYWYDGLPNSIDPRAFSQYAIPGDVDDPSFNKYPSWDPATATETKRMLLNDDGSDYKELDAKYTWNAPSFGSWGVKGDKNGIYWWPGAIPRLIHSLRDGSSQRVFFGSWESYFLIAEAAVRGWNVPMGAQDAYEMGIAESFAYWNVSSYLSEYLSSEEYNRVGTSVSWNHTAEASDFTGNYVNGYSGSSGTTTYHYPDNDIYKGGANNDHMNKIITQKFIAQNPWLGLETWNDHRRLGLPFFENPAVENPLANMPQLTDGNYMETRVDFFPQRLKYPASLANNVPDGYQQAVDLLGGNDDVFTPLWWAQD